MVLPSHLLLAALAGAAGVGAPAGEVEPGGAGVALAPDEVELGGARWKALQPEAEPAPGVMLLRREVWLRRVPGGVELRARWQLRSERAFRRADSPTEWFANGVLGPEVHLRRATWNGRDAAVWSGGQGPWVVERIEGAATLEVEAFVPGDPGAGLQLALMGAPQGIVWLEGFDDDVELRGDERPVVAKGGALSTGSSQLQLATKPTAPRDRGPLVVANVGLGVTVGDAEVRGRARVRWQIRQGTRRSLSLSVASVGEDLTVEGPAVASWRREGELVRVELGGETTGLVDLDLRWTITTPPGAEAKVPMPTVVPQDVFRSPSAVQVARDGEVDVRPQLGRGWRAVPSTLVPAWAEGLVDGTPTAAFVRARTAEGGGDTLELLRLEPVPGPPVVIDVADLRIAATEQGRVLVRARYELRNERASHLVITPPPGMALLGVEVAGREVRPARGEGGALRIPLKRSLETVKGQVTVPVTVALVGEAGGAWARRERRELPLPVVDAPVNVERVTLHLPPRYRSRLPEGEGAVVGAFDRGQEVAFGLEAPQAVVRADRAFAEAVDAWNDNDFDRAQDRLDELYALGAGGANAEGLQANVELVRPRARPKRPAPKRAMVDVDHDGLLDFADVDGEPEDWNSAEDAPMPSSVAPESSALARRIRARARARSGQSKAEFHGKKMKAKQLKDEGQYEAAAEEYRAAIEQSKELQALEDEESVVYDFEAEALEGELREIEARTGTGEAEVERRVADVVDEDGEKDFVGGVFVVLRAAGLGLGDDEGEGDGAVEVAAVRGEPAAPWALGPLVAVPEVGEVVRYQHLLLEAGEPRTVTVDAARRWFGLRRR